MPAGGYGAAPARPGSPAGSYASSMHSMATSVATGARPSSPRQRKAAAGDSESAFEVSEDEQKLLAAIQVLEAAMQAVDRNTPENRSESARLQSPSPLPGALGARKGRASRDGWVGSLAKAAAQMGLGPNWGLDEDDDGRGVDVNTDPRLAEDFSAECKVFYSKANDGRAQRAVMLADGVALAVCRGMAKNLPFAVSQEWGCRALEILAISSDHTHRVAAAGGIKSVIAAMAAHVTNESVQEAGCAALRNLTVNSDNQAKAAACGGIEAVVAAMKSHGTHVGVQEAGCQMLRNLASKSNKDKVVAAGGIEAVVLAMNGHVGDSGVQEAACVVLRKLAITPEYQQQAADAGLAAAGAAAAGGTRKLRAPRRAPEALRELAQRDSLASAYLREVVAGGQEELAARLAEHSAWLRRNGERQVAHYAQAVAARGRGGGALAPEQAAGASAAGPPSAALQLAAGFDQSAAALLLAEELRGAALGSAGGAAGSLALGATLAGSLPGGGDEALALALAASGAYVGLLSLPLRRGELKAKLGRAADALARQIDAALCEELEQELRLAREAVEALLAPWDQACVAELRRLEAQRAKGTELEQTLRSLTQAVLAL